MEKPLENANTLCEFFVVALPGLEDIVQAEISRWFPDLTTSLEHGGVTVQAPLGEGLALNLALKTATRVLLRVAKFRCKDFPKLFQKVSALDWQAWIDPTCELEVEASTRLSRLKIKKRIEEACEDGFRAYRKKLGKTASRGKKAHLFVRFVNDECVLSLDTSGERLHKRGVREHIGEAPLRETIAAALIDLVQVGATMDESTQIEIVDPMMGSGTFLVEAASKGELSDKRDFAFDNFQGSAQSKLMRKPVMNKYIKFIGFEKDGKALKAAEHNLKALKIGAKLEIHKADFFAAQPLSPLATKSTQRWVFCNPPYGERIKVDTPLGEFYTRLFQEVERIVQPTRACFLLPSKVVKGKFNLPSGWKVISKRPFLNGGLPVVAFVFSHERR